MRQVLLGATLLAAATAPGAAALDIEVFDGATLVDSVTSVSGSATLSTTDANFSEIGVVATGVPLLPNADLSTVTLNVKSASAGTHILTVDVFQTGVSAAAGTKVFSTFTTNDLVGDPGPTVEGTFFNGTDTTLGTPLQSHTFPVGDIVDSAGPFANTLATALFADAHQYVVTFTAAGQSSNDTIQLTTGVIPEPSTWTMMGVGFLGLAWAGWTRRRRNRLEVLHG